MSVLAPSFFERDTVVVARELLGHVLVREWQGKRIASVITETEAYDGPQDKACHAYGSRRTARTEPLFGRAGTWYVYLCYGMHWMLNVVTGPRDYPAAVLIRGVASALGPGRVTKDFFVGKRQNGRAALKANGLWIEKTESVVTHAQITSAPRVGIDYAEEWRDKPMRFILKAPHVCVSKVRRLKQAA